jgi:hypothetical protein
MRPDPKIELWSGDEKELWRADAAPARRPLSEGTVLHDANTHDSSAGDIVMVIPDRRFVSFMWSYPGLIPLPGREVLRIADARALAFDRILGAWWDKSCRGTATGRPPLRRSLRRRGVSAGLFAAGGRARLWPSAA